MQISSELKPALVAISGGAGDIGHAIARELAQAGADVVLCDVLPTEAASPRLETMRRTGHAVLYLTVDVTEPDRVAECFAQAAAEFGRPPNIIVPNAAIVTLVPYPELTPAAWRRELDVNLNGAFYFAQAGLQRLVASRRPGRVVFLGSWAGHAPHRHLPAYCVAKAGLRMLVRTLALEYAARGILVNEVAPGWVDAGLSGRIFEQEPGARERAAQGVPTGVLIAAAEVARQVLYLCSDDARHLTGSVLLQDGGLSLLQGPRP
jgi:glucose 1-dehydrogenase